MVLQKYATALLSLAVLVLGALATALTGVVSAVDIIQLVTLFLGGIVTFIVPLLAGGWRGGVKTGVAIATTILSAIVPFVVAGHITPAQVVLVVVAAINAAATELGVQIRLASPAASPTR